MKRVFTIMACLLAFAACEQETMEEPLETEANYDTVDPEGAMMAEENDWDLASWDADANQEITREEWNEGMNARFTSWDSDGDGVIGPDEWADTWHDWFDDNNDDIIDEDEWNSAVETYDFDGVEYGELTAWDTDASGDLSEDEWRTGYESTIWTFWDANESGDLTRDELDDQWWAFFDGNDDDIIDSDEWGT